MDEPVKNPMIGVGQNAPQFSSIQDALQYLGTHLQTNDPVTVNNNYAAVNYVGAQVQSLQNQLADANRIVTTLQTKAQDDQSAITTLQGQITAGQQVLKQLYTAAGYTDLNVSPDTVSTTIAHAVAYQAGALQATPPASPPTNVTVNPPNPILNTTTIIAGVLALAAIAGGIWWYTSKKKKNKDLSSRPTRPMMPAPEAFEDDEEEYEDEEDEEEDEPPVRRKYPMMSRASHSMATTKALMPRMRALPPRRGR